MHALSAWTPESIVPASDRLADHPEVPQNGCNVRSVTIHSEPFLSRSLNFFPTELARVANLAYRYSDFWYWKRWVYNVRAFYTGLVKFGNALRNSIAFVAVFLVSPAQAGSLNHRGLDASLLRLTSGFRARVGACVIDVSGTSCIHANQRFSLQSVMKLIVMLAVLDAVDHRQVALDDQLVVHRQDLSLYVEPIADLVGPTGYRTTVRDLIHRAVVDSDSAAADILARRIGGIQQVQAFLTKNGIKDIRIDRDERHLQTEIVGLSWRSEYVDPKVLDRAIALVPAERREAAYHRYQVDVRDTATPLGMASLLQQLAIGKLLTIASTQFALRTMAKTVTFPDRLKAGVPPDWVCMHKTGTSGSWRGVTAATNDVGILRSPGGTYLSLAVFIADTETQPQERAALMRAISEATVASFQY